MNDSKDIHGQLCELLDREGAIYRVAEHEPEGRSELIAKQIGWCLAASTAAITLLSDMSQSIQERSRSNHHCFTGNCSSIAELVSATGLGIGRDNMCVDCFWNWSLARAKGSIYVQRCFGRCKSNS